MPDPGSSTSNPRRQLEYPTSSPTLNLRRFTFSLGLRSPAILGYCLCVNELVYFCDQHTVCNDLFVCIAVAGLVHGVGLVHLPSGLRPAHLKVSSGQPVHCTCTFGKVSIPLYFAFI